ncbi:MAG: hypothetical protein R3E93_06005 [Thiothrix sp.]
MKELGKDKGEEETFPASPYQEEEEKSPPEFEVREAQQAKAWNWCWKTSRLRRQKM